MFYAISYDISDDRRRNTVSKILEAHGSRVQFSLFECNLTSDQIQELMQKLTPYINLDEDSLRCYSLCNECLKAIKCIGGKPIPRDSGYFMA